MKTLYALISLVWAVNAAAGIPEHLILKLENKIGDAVISKIEIYKNNIDPNSIRNDDAFAIKVNDREVNPLTPELENIVIVLDSSRWRYSYDALSGGINNDFSGCRMGGASEGGILYAAYLTITATAIRPIYSSGNCLFPVYTPNYSAAAQEAARVMGELQSLLGSLRES